MKKLVAISFAFLLAGNFAYGAMSCGTGKCGASLSQDNTNMSNPNNNQNMIDQNSNQNMMSQNSNNDQNMMSQNSNNDQNTMNQKSRGNGCGAGN